MTNIGEYAQQIIDEALSKQTVRIEKALRAAAVEVNQAIQTGIDRLRSEIIPQAHMALRHEREAARANLEAVFQEKILELERRAEALIERQVAASSQRIEEIFCRQTSAVMAEARAMFLEGIESAEDRWARLCEIQFRHELRLLKWVIAAACGLAVLSLVYLKLAALIV
ncbi:MAG: hypothetical protein N3A66_01980 [Planctomycetota bacterium]|nr:hypothetical protein [Planctomycetota bacterium]